MMTAPNVSVGMLGSTLAVLIAVWLLFRLVRFIRFCYRVMKVPPVELYSYHWFLGHLPDVEDRPNFFYNIIPRLSTEQRKLRRFMFGPLPLLVVAHPDTVAAILKTSAPKNMLSYSLLLPFIGDGLLVSSGKKWARDRRLLTNAFHFNILKAYTPVLHDCCQVLLDKLDQHTASEETRNKAFDFSQACCLLTLDVMLRCTMGHESNCQIEDSDYTSSVREITDLILKRALCIDLFLPNCVYALRESGRKFFRLCKECHDFSSNVISTKRDQLREASAASDTIGGSPSSFDSGSYSSQGSHPSFVDILLMIKDENGEAMSDAEIRDQVDTFLFGGHDTTSSAMQWTLYFLAKHPHIQEQCRKEADSLVQADSGCIDHDDLNNLLFTTQCIKESLRMSSPVPFIERELTEELTIDGYALPKSCSVSVDIFALHHNPSVYADPYTFDPSRFSEENCESRSPHAFVPFSAGARNCIGQNLAMNELRLAVASLLVRFTLTLDPDLPEPLYDDAVVMRAKNGINLVVARR